MRISSSDRRRADGRRFVELKPYIVVNCASAFPSAGLIDERKIILQMERCLLFREKLRRREKGEKKNIFGILCHSRSPNCSRRNVKIEFSEASDRYSICTKRSAANGHVRSSRVSRKLDGKEKCSYIDNLILIYPSRTIPSSPRRHWRLTIRLTCHRDLILKNLKATRLRPTLIVNSVLKSAIFSRRWRRFEFPTLINCVKADYIDD